MSESYGYVGIGVELGEALIRLLQKKPFDKVSVKDICEEAGVNRTTFYNYFDDKDQLLEMTMIASTEVFIAEFEKFIAEKRKNGEPIMPEQYMFHKDILRYYLELIRRYRQVFNVFAMSQGMFYSQEQFAELVNVVVLPMLEKFEIHDPRFAEYISTFYFGAMHSVIFAWIRNGCEDEIDYMIYVIQSCLHIPDELFKNV